MCCKQSAEIEIKIMLNYKKGKQIDKMHLCQKDVTVL